MLLSHGKKIREVIAGFSNAINDNVFRIFGTLFVKI